MGFILLLALTTVSIAGCAAYFSVYGLAQIFTGTFIPVIIMGGALETGKLVAASYVYRYWNTISKLIATYLIVAIVILMIITSAGIFGFLSSGYTADILPIKLKKQTIALLTKDKQELIELKNEAIKAKKLIDNDIANLPSNYVSGRIRLDSMYKKDKKEVRLQISKYTTDIRNITIKLSKLKGELLQEQVHIGPIIFIAQVLNKSTDQATTILIFLIIFVFDPLAVALTIGLNNAILQRKKTSLSKKTIENLKEIEEENIIPNSEKVSTTGLNETQQETLNEITAQKQITTNIRNSNS